MSRFTRMLPCFTLFALAASCADAPTALEVEDPQPELGPAFQVADEGPIRHLVVFNGKAPKDFEARVTALGGEVLLNHAIGVAVVSGLDEAGAESLKAGVKAQFVEREPEVRLIAPAAVLKPTRHELMFSSEVAGSVANSTDPASAILYGDQWNLHQIHAEAAWASGRLGSPGVTVAILDTGIDYMLPDLEGRVDLDRSASFVPVDDLLLSLFFPGRHPSADLHYHGTNVASQVASNAWAFAGVTSQTTLMSVKVCSVLGGCPGVVEGILFAIDNGADVINMSLGGYFTKSSNPGAVAVYNRITNYAKQQGVTLVVAAGNESIDLDRNDDVPIYDDLGNVIERVHAPSLFHSFCDATHVICVSATRRDDVPSSFTNYGRSAVDVAAPGGEGDTEDWVYSLCPQTSLLFNCAGGYFILGVAGTSQATPHVAGLAALAVEEVGRSPAQVRAYIRNSADSVDGSGNSAFYGKGRINVGRAVGALD